MAVEDILDEDLAYNNRRIIVNKLYESAFSRTPLNLPRTQSPKLAIYSLRDVYKLVRRAISHYDERANLPDNYHITFSEEYPPLKHSGVVEKDDTDPTRIISVSCVKRVPGAFDQGAPMEATIRNQKPIFREERDDPENPGYRLVTLGYFYDSIVRFTCWATTNKEANKLADLFENLMQEYDWWFKAEGVDRVLFFERREDVFWGKDSNKWYGRPLDYFIRTEKMKILSEKAIEEIVVDLTVSRD